MSTPDPSPMGSAGPELPDPIQETVTAQRVVQGTVMEGNTVKVSVVPTQLRRPWRAATRTVFQALVALAAMWGLIVATLGLPDWAWVSASLAVAAGVTRVMALPQVEAFLTRFLPFLAATPKENRA